MPQLFNISGRTVKCARIYVVPYLQCDADDAKLFFCRGQVLDKAGNDLIQGPTARKLNFHREFPCAFVRCNITRIVSNWDENESEF